MSGRFIILNITSLTMELYSQLDLNSNDLNTSGLITLHDDTYI